MRQGHDQVWYFAYGSNMSTEQIRRRLDRLPEARVARLPGYRIAFNKWSSSWRGLAANIVPDPTNEVWGVAYLCSPEDLAELDRREGVGKGGGYIRRRITVEVGGERIEAETYIAEDKESLEPEGMPPAAYANTILAGAREHGLPADYIERLERVMGLG